jgi:hypothetical protein
MGKYSVSLHKYLFFSTKKKLINIILIFVFTSLPVVSQSFNRIKLEDIPQRKVRKYVISGRIDQMNDFSLIHASWNNGINESDFNVNRRIFYLKNKLSNVWDCYRHADPVETWNRKSVQLGLMISKHSNSVIYAGNYYFPEFDTGQVYFLNLRLLKGLFNVPVAFEIINIDNNRQIFEISYINNNKSQGKQTIQFFDNGDGRTRIVHRSYFKSQSRIRDDLFYPLFHKKFIKEFHRNMRHLVKNSSPVVSILN